MNQTPPAADHPAGLRSEVRRALLWLFGLTGVMALAQWAIPFVSGFGQAVLALLMLEIPFRLAPKAFTKSLRLRIGPWAPGLRLGLLTALCVYPLFFLAFHTLQTQYLGRPADFSLSALSKWPESLEYAPPTICDGPHASVWTQHRQLWVAAPHHTLELTIDPPLTHGRRVTCGPTQRAVARQRLDALQPGHFQLPPGEGLLLELGPHRTFSLTLRDATGPLPTTQIRLGPHSEPASSPGLVEASRGYGWLFVAILIHFALVAYPEEFFFRGYLMTRLDMLWPPRWHLFGAQLGWGWILSSLAFALLHPILIPGPHRLLVFFPALLFGLLAARQKALGAAIFVHATSNLLLAVLTRFYL